MQVRLKDRKTCLALLEIQSTSISSFFAGKMPNATKDFDSDGIHEASFPEGDMTLAQPFQGWVRSTEDPTSPERDGRLQLQGISVRTDVGHPAFSRPVRTQCYRKFVVPNLQIQRLGL